MRRVDRRGLVLVVLYHGHRHGFRVFNRLRRHINTINSLYVNSVVVCRLTYGKIGCPNTGASLVSRIQTDSGFEAGACFCFCSDTVNLIMVIVCTPCSRC